MTANKVSLYGGTGFIGGRFSEMYSNNIVKIERDTRTPQTSEILYFISTINNYNIFSDPFLDVETNLTTLVETLEACRKDNPEMIFNFISSWFVYGKCDSLPASEESHCNPKGFYSITKRTAEQLLISYCETYGLNYRILRLCNVYGAGDSKASKERNALQYLTGEVVNGRDINLYDGGENIRDFLFIDDVCAAINLAIEDAPLNEIINIGSGNPHKFIDVMKHVKEVTNSPSKFHFIDPPSFHRVVQVQDMYMNVDKLRSLGFAPKYTIYDGINMLIKNLKE